MLKSKFLDAIGKEYLSLDSWPIDGTGPLLAEPSANDYREIVHLCTENYYGRTHLSLDRIEFQIDADVSPIEEPSQDITISMVSAAINGPRDIRKLKKQNIEPLPNSKDYGVGFATGQFLDRRIIRPNGKQYSRRSWTNQRIEELDQCLNNDPDIICFPEFAFPPPEYESDITGYQRKILYGQDIENFSKRIKDTIEAHRRENSALKKPFIFMGSYHCPIDFYNLGVIYPRGNAAENLKVNYLRQNLDREGDSNEDQPRVPIFQRKRFPARRADERSKIPPEVSFCTYHVGKLRVGILICSDIIDLNQFLNMVRLNSVRTDRKPLDLILVPAYNTNVILKSMCRELSFMCSNMVVYVNANPSFPEFPESEIFYCGYGLKEIEEQLEYVETPLLLDEPLITELPVPDDPNDSLSRVTTIRLSGVGLAQLSTKFRKLGADVHPSNRLRRKNKAA